MRVDGLKGVNHFFTTIGTGAVFGPGQLVP